MRASGRQESWVVQSLVSGPTLVLGVILGKLLVSLPQSHLETGLTEVAAMLSAGGWKRATHRVLTIAGQLGDLLALQYQLLVQEVSQRSFAGGFGFVCFLHLLL